jgi:heptosyltransferase-1
MMSKAETPKRILIVKLSAIGDVVMATPTAQSIRLAYPNAHIAWLVEKRCADVLKGNPNLDEVLVYDRQRGAKALPAAISMAIRLRRLRFDTAIDLQGLARSGVMAFASGARTRIGFADGRESSHIFYNKRVKCSVEPHGMSCHRTLLHAIGISLDRCSDTMLFPLSDDDRASAGALLASVGLPENARIASLCPGTTRAYKHWVEERWAELADWLSGQGYTPVFLGSPVEEPLISRIRLAAKCDTISLAGKTSLKAAAAVLATSALSVTVDNGVMHMSVALGVPTVAVFGPTTAYINHVERPNFAVARKDFACAPCRRKITCENFDCIRAVTVEDVASACEKLVSSGVERSSRV